MTFDAAMTVFSHTALITGNCGETEITFKTGVQTMKTLNVALEQEASNLSFFSSSFATHGLKVARRTLRGWRERARTRHALRNLSPAGLDDIGLSRDAALVESYKPFWRE